MKRLLAAFALTLLQPTLAHAADAALNAKQTTQKFYAWYVEAIADDKAPLIDNAPEMKTYVSDTLLDSLQKQMSSEDGLDEDYFTKSQDYDDTWLTNIKVTERPGSSAIKTEDVVLGTTQDNSVALTVQLTQGKTGWRITKVDGVKTGLTPD